MLKKPKQRMTTTDQEFQELVDLINFDNQEEDQAPAPTIASHV